VSKNRKTNKEADKNECSFMVEFILKSKILLSELSKCKFIA